MDLSLLIAGFSVIIFISMWYALAETRGALLLRLAALVTTVFCLGFFTYAAIRYLTLPFYLDHLEPSVAAIGYASLHNGQALFHSSVTPSLYNLPYGPALYLLNMLPISLFGPGIVVSKIAGVSALFVTCTLLWLTLKKQGASNQYATVSVLALLGLVMTTDNEAYWNRPEPFLLLCAALGLYATADTRYPRPFWLVFAIALAADLKPHALLYFTSYIFSAYRSLGTKKSIIYAAMTILLAALPFLLPQISLINYIEVLRKTAQHTFVPAILWDNLLFLAVLFGPLVVISLIRWSLSRPLPRTERLNLLIMLLAGLVVAVIGAKAGAGKHHLWPFSLFILASAHTHWIFLAEIRFGRCLRAGLLTMVGLGAANGMGVQYGMFEYLQRSLQQQLVAKEELIEMIQLADGRSMEMGYGSTVDYQTTFVRPLLVYTGQPYHLDAAALMDMKFYGIDIMKVWNSNFKECKPKLWIIPHNQSTAFMMSNWYIAGPSDVGDDQTVSQSLFSDEFRNKFNDRHIKIREGKIFDLYQCR